MLQQSYLFSRQICNEYRKFVSVKWKIVGEPLSGVCFQNFERKAANTRNKSGKQFTPIRYIGFLPKPCRDFTENLPEPFRKFTENIPKKMADNSLIMNGETETSAGADQLTTWLKDLDRHKQHQLE